MLEQDETLLLIAKAQLGDETAKTILVESNSPLIKSIVRRYKNKGVDYDDLYQLGCVGFLKAINNFDQTFNVKFSTYAVPMIAGEIKRFLRDDGSIKVSRAIKGQHYLMQKYMQEKKSKTGEIPSIRELSEVFKIDEQEVFFILESSIKPISIYEQFDNDASNGQVLLDRISQYEDSELFINKLLLKDIIKSLDEKDRKIIMLRYFRDKTQSEVAEILNVSQVQVSRLENRIIKKIKLKLG